MGGYVLIIGIIGVVMGLIYVMGNLVNLVQFGSGIVVVFVVIIYGVGFVNLFLLLIGNKLKILVLCQLCYCEMFLEGLLFIVEGENLCFIELKL